MVGGVKKIASSIFLIKLVKKITLLMSELVNQIVDSEKSMTTRVST